MVSRKGCQIVVVVDHIVLVVGKRCLREFEELDTLELTSGIKMIDSINARIVVLDSTKGLCEFDFDGVMKDDIKQNEVYDVSTSALVCDVINGVNATCLVYGQTGSGKTFTMFGAPESQSLPSSFVGIVPRACSDLMEPARYRKPML